MPDTKTETLIRIDRSTLRRNPSAGETQSFVQTGPVVQRVTLIHPAWSLCLESIGGEFHVLMSIGIAPFSVCDAVTIDQLHSLVISDFHIECRTDFMEGGEYVLHAPLPDWLFSYESQPVRCRECGESFDHSQLESDDYGDSYSFAVCPKCGAADCCDVEYESPETVAREINA